MADDQKRDRSEGPTAERCYVERVEVSLDDGTDNEPLRAALDEKLRRGWKLVSMIRSPSGDGVELTWDTGGR